MFACEPDLEARRDGLDGGRAWVVPDGLLALPRHDDVRGAFSLNVAPVPLLGLMRVVDHESRISRGCAGMAMRGA